MGEKSHPKCLNQKNEINLIKSWFRLCQCLKLSVGQDGSHFSVDSSVRI